MRQTLLLAPLCLTAALTAGWFASEGPSPAAAQPGAPEGGESARSAVEAPVELRLGSMIDLTHTFFQSHVTLCKHNVPVFENVALRQDLPPRLLVAALPTKIGGGSGAPLRIVAIAMR